MPATTTAFALEKFTTFGDLLRYLRRRAGLTQRELAIAVGYSDGQISRLEQNLRLPDLPTIPARFASALDIENEPGLTARLMELAAAIRREDAPASGVSPFKGLRCFEEADADLFFGREELIARLLARITVPPSDPKSARFLAIVGASGSGKSSLLRAGLVPSLRWNQPSAGWSIAALTPTARPLQALAACLSRESDSLSGAAALADDLARDSRSLHLCLSRPPGEAAKGERGRPEASHSLGAPAAGPRHILVIDQFEELFTLCRDEAERRAFIDNLMTAATERSGPAFVLITLCADFYDQCAPYVALREAIASQQEYIGSMTSVELQRAIEEPARRGNWELEPGLVDILLEEVAGEPGSLPLLSHALLETWQRRRGRKLTLSGYIASGGVRGAIAETAEAVFHDQLGPEQRAVARNIFLRLTAVGESDAVEDTRRRVTFDELITSPADSPTVRAVLTLLADARLITTDDNQVEVAHEALIREWPTLRGWLEENRAGLRVHRHLTETAEEWDARGRDPAELYRGARLAQAREWAQVSAEGMNALERAFLAASIEQEQHDALEREAQRQRELAAAHKLAETEKARAGEQAASVKRLRQRGQFLAGALTLAVVAAISAGIFAGTARSNEAIAVRERLSAQRQALIASVRELSNAANLNLEIDPERSILLALQAVNKTYSVDHTILPEAADALHRAVAASRVALTLRGHSGAVWSAVFSPDGARIATAGADGTARIWDAATGKDLLTVQASTGIVWYAAFSPNGKVLATAGQDKLARLWDADTGQALQTFAGHAEDVYHVEFSPDGSRLLTVSPDGTSKLWDVLTGQELLTLTEDPGGQPQWGAFSPDGSRIAIANLAGDNEGWVTVWDAATGQKRLTLPHQHALVTSVTFSPNGTRLVTTSNDRTARIWDANDGRELLTLYGQTEDIVNAAYSPDGTLLATAIWDRQIKVWRADTGQEAMTLAGHSSGITTVAFSPDGARIVTASKDQTARVWDISPDHELLTLVNGPVIASAVGAKIAYSPDGSRLAVAYSDPIAKVWDAKTGQLLLRLAGHTDDVNYITYNSDGSRIATAARDGTARVWDAVSGQQLLTISVPGKTVFGVAFSPDGSRLTTSSSDEAARIWDARTGQAISTLAGHTDLVFSVVFSPDGSRLATSGRDGTVIVWDAATGKALFHVTGGNMRQVVFSPDGTRLATADLNANAKVWDAQSGKELLNLAGHAGGVFSVAFSPDGKTLATASGDKTAKLWDALTGQELLTLHAPDGLTSVAFSPDGSQLAAAGRDGTDRIFLLKIEDLVALARQRVTRALTSEECVQYLHVASCP